MKQRKHMIRVIFLFLMIVGIFIPLEGKAKETDTFNIHVEGKRDYDFAYEVLSLVNEERQKQGLNPLTLDVDLMEAAMLRSGEISLYFYHTRPDGNSCYTICDKMSGENIAAGQKIPEDVVEDWMSSVGHRANILNSSYQSIGIGCFWNGRVCYWVQCFGYGEAEGRESVQTSGTEEVKQEITVHRNNLELYVFSVEDSVNPENMFIGETGYFRYGWNNQTGFAYCTGVQEDFQFTSDNPEVISVTEDGKFVVQSEGITTLRVALKADSTIEWTKQMETRQQDLSNEKYAYIYNVYNDYMYTGSAIEPIPIVYHSIYDVENQGYDYTLLEEGTDYTFSYENNKNVGIGRIIIKGKGKYKGTRICEFEIIKAYQVNCMVYSYEGIYDKQPHGIRIIGMEEGSTVEYSTDNSTWTETPPERTEVGETIVYYQITNPNYETITGQEKISITAKWINDCTFLPVDNTAYSGDAITPDITIKDGETVLQKGRDYELEYNNNVEAGNAEIVVTGMNQYKGSQAITFSIIRDISTLEYEEFSVQLYKGYELEPDVIIKDGDKTLRREIDYSVEFDNNIAPGKATAVVSGSGRYSGTKILEFSIKKELSLVYVTYDREGKIYTGSPICPKVTVRDEDTEMQEGTDYTVTYGENINIGKGTITLEGKGNYTGTRVIEFQILEKKDLTKLVFLPILDQKYTGEQICPKASIWEGGMLLDEGIDYELTYGENTASGIGQIYVKGIGDYIGEYVMTFKIVSTANGNVTNTSSKKSQTETSSTISTSDTVLKEEKETSQEKNTADKTKVQDTTEQTEGSSETTDDTTSTELKSKKVAKVKSLQVKIKKNAIVLKWKKVKEINGYQIQISSSSKYKNVVKATVGKGKTKYTFTNQKAGTKNYIRIRAYKKYTAEDGTYKKSFGKWFSVCVEKA